MLGAWCDVPFIHTGDMLLRLSEVSSMETQDLNASRIRILSAAWVNSPRTSGGRAMVSTTRGRKLNFRLGQIVAKVELRLNVLFLHTYMYIRSL